MSTELDDDLIPEALALVAEFGADAEIATATRTYDRTTGNTTDSAAQTYPVKVTPPWPRSKGFAPQTTVVDDSMTVFMAASGLPFVPEEGQTLTLFVELAGTSMAAGSYQIVGATPIMSGQGNALWELKLES